MEQKRFRAGGCWWVCKPVSHAGFSLKQAYDETGMGASVDAFALEDRQCIDRLLGWVPQ